MGNVAGVCNERGNVFGLMPHPERYVMLCSIHCGVATGEGDGLRSSKMPTAMLYHCRTGRLDLSRALATSTGSIPSYAASGVNIAAAEQAKS